jgi:hypothetical protein
MSETTRLTVPEVQTVLRLASLPPGDQSPFAGLSPPAAIEQPVVASLKTKGVLNGNGMPTGAWVSALRTLSAPTQRITLFLASAERWFEASYYGSGGGLIGFTPSPGECAITFPGEPADVEVLLADWLNWKRMPEAAPFTATLLGPEVTAFAAIVDAHREEALRAFLERRPANHTRFSRDQLAHQVAQADSMDSRWLCAALRRHAPEAIRPDPQSLNVGARSMMSRGLLRFEGETLVVEGELLGICAGLGTIVPYAFLTSQRAGGAPSSSLYFVGMGSFWIFEFPQGADGQPVCRFQTAGGQTVAAHVRRHLEGLSAAKPAAASWTAPVAAAATAEPARPQPAAAQPPAARPPVSQPTGPIAKLCGKCGKPLKPGKKFCGSCGAAV